MIRLALIFLLLGYCTLSNAQRIAYEEPRKLADAVNSEAEETMPLISADGSTLYFSRILFGENIGGETAGQDIWYSSTGEDGAWTRSKNDLTKLNNKFDNAIIGIGDDEKTFYLLNSYKKKGKMGVSVTTMENRIWSVPSGLDIPRLESTSGLYGFYMHPEGKILMISMEGSNSSGKEDIYVCLKAEDGKWSEPINLGSTINSDAFEITPFIDVETNKLYFSTDGRDGLGSADIYVSERMDDTWTNWSLPENLKEPINSVGFDAFFSLNPSGDVFFSSNRSGELNDIFYSNTKRADPEPESELEIYYVQRQEQPVVTENALVETSESITTEPTNQQESAESGEVSESVDDIMNEILAEGAVDEAEENTLADNVEVAAEETSIMVVDESESAETVDRANDGEEPIVEEPSSTALEEKPIVVESEKSEEALEEISRTESAEPVAEAVSEPEPEPEPDVVAEETSIPSEDNSAAVEEKVIREPVRSSSPALASGTTERIYFDHNSSYLSEKAQRQLRELSKRIAAIMSTNKIEVVGYSDNTGEQHYNLWITERRANRVIAFLAENGIESSVFVAQWKGADNPLKHCSDCTEEENEANRRVEIILR